MSNGAKRVHRFAREEGYVLTPTGSGHFKALHPNGARVILSASITEARGKREIDRLRKEKRRRTEQ
jgi:hypothetical protein